MFQFNGGRLAEYRKRASLTQAQVAEVLETTQQSVARWEAGRTEPTISMLCTLADFYAVTLDEFIGRTVPDDPSVEVAPPEREFRMSASDLPKIAKAIRTITSAAGTLEALLPTQAP